MKILTYDIEIIKPPFPRDRGGEIDESKLIDGIEYCENWESYNDMGISIIGVDFWVGNSSSTCALEMNAKDVTDFNKLVAEADWCVGFNNYRFDNNVLAANEIMVPTEKTYDILRELWIADGLDPDKYNFATHRGTGLDACAKANGLPGKTGDGLNAAILWQQGRRNEVIDYCLNDVAITKALLERVIEGEFIHPKISYRIDLRIPGGK